VMTWCAERGMNRGSALMSARSAIKKWGQPKPRPTATKSAEPAAFDAIRSYAESRGIEL
jgi:hypothetical protein